MLPEMYQLLEQNLEEEIEDLNNACMKVANDCDVAKKHCENFYNSSDEKQELDIQKIASFAVNLTCLSAAYFEKNDPHAFDVFNSFAENILQCVGKISNNLDNKINKNLIRNELLLKFDAINLMIFAAEKNHKRTLIIQFDKDCHPEYESKSEKILAELADVKKQLNVLIKAQTTQNNKPNEMPEAHSKASPYLFRK